MYGNRVVWKRALLKTNTHFKKFKIGISQVISYDNVDVTMSAITVANVL